MSEIDKHPRIQSFLATIPIVAGNNSASPWDLSYTVVILQ